MPGRYRGVSEALRLELHAERNWFRLFDPAGRVHLRNPQESEQALAAERLARLSDQQALTAERAARAEMERLLREHGIEPPAV